MGPVNLDHQKCGCDVNLDVVSGALQQHEVHGVRRRNARETEARTRARVQLGERRRLDDTRVHECLLERVVSVRSHPRVDVDRVGCSEAREARRDRLAYHAGVGVPVRSRGRVEPVYPQERAARDVQRVLVVKLVTVGGRDLRHQRCDLIRVVLGDTETNLGDRSLTVRLVRRESLGEDRTVELVVQRCGKSLRPNDCVRLADFYVRHLGAHQFEGINMRDFTTRETAVRAARCGRVDRNRERGYDHAGHECDQRRRELPCGASPANFQHEQPPRLSSVATSVVLQHFFATERAKPCFGYPFPTVTNRQGRVPVSPPTSTTPELGKSRGQWHVWASHFNPRLP